MIKGVGIDLTDILRFKDDEKLSALLNRFFSDDEKAYIHARGICAAKSAAACFAAKEAFLKAIGIGISQIPLKDISIEHDGNGAPFYVLSDAAIFLMKQRGGSSTWLSISHDKDIAVAVCVIEG